MSHPTFAGIGGHDRQKRGKEEWLTPPAVTSAIGGWQWYDLDPCAPIVRPWPTAKHHFTIKDNGLIQDWRPYHRIFVNPPYTAWKLRLWMARMAAHNCGVALIFARTETEVWARWVWERATAVLFLKGRLSFHHVDGSLQLRPNGAPRDAGAPSALCAYGREEADMLASCGLSGAFVPLIVPRSILAMFVGSWADFLAANFPDGDFHIDDAYRVAAIHPKARTNRHVRAKLRQTLNGRGFHRLGSGRYRRVCA